MKLNRVADSIFSSSMYHFLFSHILVVFSLLPHSTFQVTFSFYFFSLFSFLSFQATFLPHSVSPLLLEALLFLIFIFNFCFRSFSPKIFESFFFLSFLIILLISFFALPIYYYFFFCSQFLLSPWFSFLLILIFGHSLSIATFQSNRWRVCKFDNACYCLIWCQIYVRGICTYR